MDAGTTHLFSFTVLELVLWFSGQEGRGGKEVGGNTSPLSSPNGYFHLIFLMSVSMSTMAVNC